MNFLIEATTDVKFTIVISALTVPIPLYSGIIQTGKAQAYSTQSYSFKLTSLRPFSIALTPFTESDPDIFVTSPDGSRKWNSTAVGADHVNISPVTADLNKEFAIVVEAINASVHTVLVLYPNSTDSETAVTLLSGFPQEDFLPAKKERFFKLYVPPGKQEVKVTVDSVWGDADVYVNSELSGRGFYRYSEDSPAADWSSTSTESDSVSILSFNRKFISTGGAYLVTVYADSDSQYLIRGYTASTVVTLTQDRPLKDTVSRGYYHYYRFYDFTAGDLMFDLASINGDADLYLDCRLKNTGDDSGYPSRSPGHFSLSSAFWGEDSLVVRKSDAKACESGVYFLAVHGHISAAASSYMLTVRPHDGLVYLRAGQPFPDTIYRHVGVWYRFNVGAHLSAISVVTTPSSGDCDVFVKVNGKAYLNNFDYASYNWGATVDRVTIPKSKSCINCYLSILVYADQTSQYTILVTLEDTVTQLTDGVPVKQSAARGRIQYFSYTPSSSGVLIITLSLFGGYPKIYVSTNVTSPTSATASTVTNNDAVRLNLPIMNYAVISGETVYIGVGDDNTHNCTFTIRAYNTYRNHTPILSLPNGLLQTDFIDELTGWKYYYIRLQAGNEALDVRVTRFVGDVDIMLSRCPYASAYDCVGDGYSFLPNETYHVAAAFGSSSVDANDDFYSLSSEYYYRSGFLEDTIHYQRSDALPYTYLIGLKSKHWYTEYEVSATTQGTSLTLTAGVSVTDHVERGEADYFTFYMDAQDNALKIVVTPISGDPDVFVSTTVRKPSPPTNFTWASTAYGGDVLVIDPTLDMKACRHCNYYIAVVGVTPSTYSITASSFTSVNRLSDGMPLNDHVQPYAWNFYLFTYTFRNSRDVKISCTPKTGQVGVYVRLDGGSPSWFNYDYYRSSFTLSTVDIQIMRTDSKFQPCLDGNCNIRIGVYGFSGSQYTLTLTTSTTATVLQLDEVKVFSVAASSYEYYKIPINSNTYVFRLRQTLLSGHVATFVSCSRRGFNYPSIGDHIWKLVGGASLLEVPSAVAREKDCANATSFSVAVYGISAATYSLLASMNEDSVPSVYVGLPVTGRVDNHVFDYYVFQLPDESQNIRVSVTVLDGDVDTYLSSSWVSRPQYVNGTVTSYFDSIAGAANDVLVIRQNRLRGLCASSGVASCYLILGVFGTGGAPSSYRMVVSTQDSSVLLSSGVPVMGHVDLFRSDFYVYSRSVWDTDVFIAVTALHGDPDFSVNLKSYDGRNFSWTASDYGSDTLTIQARELNDACLHSNVSSCDLKVRVLGLTENSSYTIVAAMDEGFVNPTLLLEGRPQTGFVAKNQFVYYRFVIGSNSSSRLVITESVTLTLSPLDDGDQVCVMRWDSISAGWMSWEIFSPSLSFCPQTSGS